MKIDERDFNDNDCVKRTRTTKWSMYWYIFIYAWRLVVKSSIMDNRVIIRCMWLAFENEWRWRRNIWFVNGNIHILTNLQLTKRKKEKKRRNQWHFDEEKKREYWDVRQTDDDRWIGVMICIYKYLTKCTSKVLMIEEENTFLSIR